MVSADNIFFFPRRGEMGIVLYPLVRRSHFQAAKDPLFHLHFVHHAPLDPQGEAGSSQRSSSQIHKPRRRPLDPPQRHESFPRSVEKRQGAVVQRQLRQHQVGGHPDGIHLFLTLLTTHHKGPLTKRWTFSSSCNGMQSSSHSPASHAAPATTASGELWSRDYFTMQRDYRPTGPTR